MRTAWIDRNGQIHEGDDIVEIAETLFPRVSDPVYDCEARGFIFVSQSRCGNIDIRTHSVFMETDPQKKTLQYLTDEHNTNKYETTENAPLPERHQL